jgi:hypothetical protein
VRSWTPRYILVGHEPVPEPDLFAWAAWFETADRHVALDTVGGYHVSTVFLGLDHNLFGDGPPLLFETMVFHLAGGGEDLDMERYTTWDEAVAGHARIVAALRAEISN